MFEQPRTRQELYNSIRNKGTENFVLEEMMRLGFWLPENEIKKDKAQTRIKEINQELIELQKEILKSNKIADYEAFKRQLKEKRLAASRQKLAENRARRERKRQEKTIAWKEKKQRKILYLGEEVSAGLNNTESNLQRLEENGLPILNNSQEIAIALEISMGELRFLAFNRRTSTVTHYIKFKIPKKTGGERLISAPMPRLKQVQYWILNNILNKLKIHDAAHGFIRDRSILTNARPHIRASTIINFDLQDFFTSITYKRVKGLFRSFGYSEAVATIFGLLCTEAELDEVELDNTTYYIALGARFLPQGAPTSPAISNLLCRRLDKRLTKTAQRYNFVYTRYADDLTFSTAKDNNYICNILRQTESIVKHEGFTINQEKTRILRHSRQQEVTGIVVNEKPSIDRKTLKRFRATLYQIEKDGIAGEKWGNSDNVMAAIKGFANYIAMVDAEKGAVFLEQIKRIESQNR